MWENRAKIRIIYDTFWMMGGDQCPPGRAQALFIWGGGGLTTIDNPDRVDLRGKATQTKVIDTGQG